MEGGGAYQPPPVRSPREFPRGLALEERRLATSWKGVLYFLVGAAIVILVLILITS